MNLFLRGLIIGFSIAAPVGPIGVLCIRRTLAEGRLTGFLSGMGAASADMFYTITNPLTILSFLAIFAGLRLAETNGDYASATVMVLGVFLGSAVWWLTLSTGVSFLREKFTPALLTWVNRLAGVIIFAFGLAALIL
jgi:threonine/homoserine/homoserine lactone efflux protein